MRRADLGEYRIVRAIVRMHAHHGVAALRADEAGFLTVVRTEMFVVFDATRKR